MSHTRHVVLEETIEDLFSVGNFAEIVKLFCDTFLNGPASEVDPNTASRVLHALALRFEFDRLIQLFDEIARAGVALEVEHFNQALFSCAVNADLHTMKRILQAMNASNVKPNDTTRLWILRTHTNARSAEFDSCFQSMLLEKKIGRHGIAVMYSEAIHNHLANKRPQEAINCFEAYVNGPKVGGKDPEIDSIFLSQIMRALYSLPRVDESKTEALIARFMDRAGDPRVDVWNALLFTYYRSGNFEKARFVFEKVRDLALSKQPNTAAQKSPSEDCTSRTFVTETETLLDKYFTHGSDADSTSAQPAAPSDVGALGPSFERAPIDVFQALEFVQQQPKSQSSPTTAAQGRRSPPRTGGVWTMLANLRQLNIDVTTFVFMMNVYTRTVNQPREAVRLFHEMHTVHGLSPTPMAVTAYLEACSVLQDAEAAAEIEPHLHSLYTQSFVRNEGLPSRKLWENLPRSLQRFSESTHGGAEFTNDSTILSCYQTLFSIYRATGQAHRIVHAYDYLRFRGITPGHIPSDAITAVLTERDDTQGLAELYQERMTSGQKLGYNESWAFLRLTRMLGTDPWGAFEWLKTQPMDARFFGSLIYTLVLGNEPRWTQAWEHMMTTIPSQKERMVVARDATRRLALHADHATCLHFLSVVCGWPEIDVLSSGAKPSVPLSGPQHTIPSLRDEPTVKYLVSRNLAVLGNLDLAIQYYQPLFRLGFKDHEWQRANDFSPLVLFHPDELSAMLHHAATKGGEGYDQQTLEAICADFLTTRPVLNWKDEPPRFWDTHRAFSIFFRLLPHLFESGDVGRAAELARKWFDVYVRENEHSLDGDVLHGVFSACASTGDLELLRQVITVSHSQPTPLSFLSAQTDAIASTCVTHAQRSVGAASADGHSSPLLEFGKAQELASELVGSILDSVISQYWTPRSQIGVDRTTPAQLAALVRALIASTRQSMASSLLPARTESSQQSAEGVEPSAGGAEGAVHPTTAAHPPPQQQQKQKQAIETDAREEKRKARKRFFANQRGKPKDHPPPEPTVQVNFFKKLSAPLKQQINESVSRHVLSALRSADTRAEAWDSLILHPHVYVPVAEAAQSAGDVAALQLILESKIAREHEFRGQKDIEPLCRAVMEGFASNNRPQDALSLLSWMFAHKIFSAPACSGLFRHMVQAGQWDSLLSGLFPLMKQHTIPVEVGPFYDALKEAEHKLEPSAALLRGGSSAPQDSQTVSLDDLDSFLFTPTQQQHGGAAATTAPADNSVRSHLALLRVMTRDLSTAMSNVSATIDSYYSALRKDDLGSALSAARFMFDLPASRGLSLGDYEEGMRILAAKHNDMGVLKLYDMMRNQAGVLGSIFDYPEVFQHALRAPISQDTKKVATTLFTDMEVLPFLRRNPLLIVSLLQLMGKMGLEEKANTALEWLMGSLVSLNSVAATRLVRSATSALQSHPDILSKLTDSLLSANFSPYQKDSTFFGNLLRAALFAVSPSLTMRVYNAMKAAGLPPSEQMYLGMFRLFANSRDVLPLELLSRVPSIVRDFDQQGHEIRDPDVYTSLVELVERAQSRQPGQFVVRSMKEIEKQGGSEL